MPDVEAVEVNFDGITYAKGASVIKQLVAYVGIDDFLTGLRSYFAAHAWSNATFNDLLSALESASGRQLQSFADQWLQTAPVNTIRPIVSLKDDGTYASVSVAQEAPSDHPTLRTHRIGVGLYELVGDTLVRRERHEVDISGAMTALPALTNVRAADVLLLNDDDLSYTKLRLDERSLSTVVDHIAGFESSLPRALCWAATWDMTRDAEMAARDYVALVCSGLPRETDINLVTATLRQAQLAVNSYADPAWAPTGWAMLADMAFGALATAQPGSGFRLAWARAFNGAARRPEDLAVVRGWLDGTNVPQGLSIDTDLRWSLLSTLVAHGAATAAEIEAELDRDRTASGERAAATARALIPTEESKAETWRLLTGEEELANWLQRSLLLGFYHSSQLRLTASYVPKFFDVVDEIWASRSSEPAQEFVFYAYPSAHVDQSTVDLTDAWLAGQGHPAPLRRLVAEGKDGVVRALAARAKDAAS